MAAPVLQDWTMRRGALTLAPTASLAGGGVPMAGLMQTGGDTVVTWSVTSGDMTGLQINATTGALTASVAGGFGQVTIDRTLVIRATNVDGFDEATLTVVCVANAYSVSNIADTASSGTGTTARKAAMGGKTIMFSYGMDVNLAGGTSRVDINAYNTHTGRFTITSEFVDAEANYTTLRLFRITNSSTRIDVEKLRFAPYLASSNASSNAQNTGALTITGSASDITLTDVGGGAPSGTLIQQWYTGLSISTASNVTATNMRWFQCKNGIALGECTGCTISDFVVDTFASSGVFAGGNVFSNNAIENGIIVRGYRNPIDVGDHTDNFQFGSLAYDPGPPPVSTRTQSYDGNVARNVRFYQVNSNGAQQGPYFDDVGYAGQVGFTGYGQNNWVVENLAGDFFKLNPTTDVGTGWALRNSSYWRSLSSEDLGQAFPAINSPAIAADMFNPTFTCPWDDTKTTGLATGIVAMNVALTSAGQFGDWDANNYTFLNDHGALPASVNQTTQVPADLAAYYVAADTFADPASAVGVDWASMSAEEIDTLMNACFRAKLNGALKNADGTYKGMWFPDGTLNDGTVYQLTPPAAITSSIAVTEAVVGQPVEVTFQLDAVANQSVSIDPGVSGVTGTFSPDPVSIAISEATGTTTFTPTSAGTASITCTNNRSLTNPTAITLPVTAPPVDPTLYTQVADASVIALGQSVTIVYTLDEIATSDVIITPASTLAGTFTPPTATVGFGSLTASATFTPSTFGSATLSATNDSSLANPATIALTVSACNAGQLIMLGIR